MRSEEKIKREKKRRRGELREDEVKGSITREEALQNAAVHDEQFFKTPKVIKK